MRDLQRRVGNRAAARLLQRKVGFEFETPWTLKAPANTIGSDSPAIEGSGGEPRERLWHVSPDMKPPPRDPGFRGPPERAPLHPDFRESRREVPAPGMWGLMGVSETKVIPPRYQGFGNLEFITGAFEESQSGQENLMVAMKQIQYLLARFFRFYPGNVPLREALSTDVRWGEHVNQQARGDDIVVDTTATPQGTLWASMQMTAGIKLEKLLTLLSEMAARTALGRMFIQRPNEANQQRWAGEYHTAVTGAHTAVTRMGAGDYARRSETHRTIYLGAVANLAHVILAGEKADAAQAKYVVSLLSRTNFGSLPEDIRQGGFKAHVLGASGADPQRKLFPKAPSLYSGTVGEWLDAVVAGRDPVNWGQGRDDPRWVPQQVGLADQRAVGHVYEFRNIDNVDSKDWSEAALKYFQAAVMLNRNA